MVDQQIRARGISDEAVLKAMRSVPRHEFVPKELIERAYDDCPLPIGEGQTVSQPYMVAIMTQLLELDESKRVLEIGTGSGYQAAVLSEICKEVVTVERVPLLFERAYQTLKRLHYAKIKTVFGDGTQQLSKKGPLFDGIIITAAAPEKPEYMFPLLAERGRLVAPVGTRDSQTLYVYTKTRGRILGEAVCGCTFVPLIGKFGWSPSEDNQDIFP